MPRTIQVSLSPDQTVPVLERVRSLDGVFGLSLQRGASLEPPGDLLSVQATNDATRRVTDAVLALAPGSSLHTSELAGVVAPGHARTLGREPGETTADELSGLLRDFSNPTFNFLLLITLSGSLAATGFWSGQLPYILAAQLLGPHVEPLLRLPSGLLNGPTSSAGRGLVSVVAGYVLLALGAALTFLVLHRLGPGTSLSLGDRSLARSFSGLTVTNVVAEGTVALAAGFILSSRRTVLMSGVYVGLALVPSMALVGMGLATGQGAVARGAALRWTFNALAVIVLGGLALGVKQALVYRRRAQN